MGRRKSEQRLSRSGLQPHGAPDGQRTLAPSNTTKERDKTYVNCSWIIGSNTSMGTANVAAVASLAWRKVRLAHNE